MQYAIYPLLNLGFVDDEGNTLASVDGRDNRTEPFRHLGYTGYPDGRLATYDDDPQNKTKTKTLSLFEDGAQLPEGGKEIAATDVLALLVAEYGWPQGTTLVNGRPVRPTE